MTSQKLYSLIGCMQLVIIGFAPSCMATDAQTPAPPPAPTASEAEQIIVYGSRPHFVAAPLPSDQAGRRDDAPDFDPASGATLTEFGPAYGSATPVLSINPAGNWAH